AIRTNDAARNPDTNRIPSQIASLDISRARMRRTAMKKLLLRKRPDRVAPRSGASPCCGAAPGGGTAPRGGASPRRGTAPRGGSAQCRRRSAGHEHGAAPCGGKPAESEPGRRGIDRDQRLAEEV